MRVPELELELEFEFNAIAELELELVNSSVALVRKRFDPLPLHHQNLCLSLFELQGQLAMYSAASANLRPKAC